MRKFIFTLIVLVILTITSIFSFNTVNAQTTGLIYKPAVNGGNKVLDPNGDGYVSLTHKGFPGINMDEGTSFSEIPYKPFPVFMDEPLSDLGTGAKLGHTDYAPKGTDSSPLNVHFDGTNFLFRIRLAGQSTASKGYSILIDTNNMLNSTGKNPGFEFEVLLASNFDVRVYDHRNNVNANPTIDAVGPIIFNGSVDQYSQKAVASSVGGGNPDYFYDFYVPLSAFNGGITTSTPLRMTGVTVTSAKSGLFGVASDIGGVDDTKYRSNLIGALRDVIGSYPPTTPTGIQSGGFAQMKAKAPVVNGPIIKASGANTIINGYSVEAPGSIIEVFQNGVIIGTTTVQTDGTWSIPIAESVLVADRLITATVKPITKTVSDLSNAVKVGTTSCFNNTPPRITGLTAGNKGLTGTTTLAGILHLYEVNTPNTPVATGTLTAGATWAVDFGKSGGSIPNGTYYATIITDGCESNISNQLCYSANGNGNGNAQVSITNAPTISPSSITTTSATLTITNNSSRSATLTLTKNGIQIASSSTIASNNNWVISVSNLQDKDILYARATTVDGACTTTSGRSNAATVSIASTPVQSTAPVITGSYCGTTTSISGTSSELPGTSIRVFNGATLVGTTPVNAFGSWTLNGLNIPGGSTVTATALAANKTESPASAPRSISSAYTGATPAITSSPVVEGDVNLRGTAPSSTIITLYINGEPLVDVDGNPKTVTTNGSGIWEFTNTSITPFDLYAGAKLTVTAKTTASSSCESAPSAQVEVQCKAPNRAITPSFSQPKYCPGSEVTVNLSTSESGIIYNLYRKDGSVFGYSVLGNGKPISLTSYPVNTSGIVLNVKTIKIGASCSSQIGGDLTVLIYEPVPNNFTLSATNTSGCPGTSSTITVNNAVTGFSYQLINFQTKQKIGNAVVPTTNGNLNFPPISVSQTTEYGVIITRLDGGCIAENENAQRITITRTGPTVNQAVTPANSTICLGSSVSFSFSTQSLFVYRLIDKSNMMLVGSPITGNGATMSLSTGNINTTGTKTYLIEVTGSMCNSYLTTEPTVTVANGPASSISAGPNQTVCGTTTTLQGSNPAPGTGTWSKTSGPAGGTITNPNSQSTTITGLISGTYVYTWSVTTSCGGGTIGSSTVTITVNCPAATSVNTTKYIDEYSNNEILAVISDVDGGIVNFTRTQGVLPPGTALELVGNQVVLKVVNGPLLSAGNFSFTTQTTDASSAPAAAKTSSSPLLIRMYSRSTPPTPLPVQLVNFIAYNNDGKVNLEWTTASEMDNDRFEIERSYDNINFVTIGNVKGQGFSNSSKRYNFTDNQPGNRLIYYRLKQVDFSGAYQYSKTVTVNVGSLNEKLSFAAYPNPFNDKLYATINAPQSGNVTLELFDLRGQLVWSELLIVSGGMNDITIPVTTLPKGIYLIKATGHKLSKTIKLVKSN